MDVHRDSCEVAVAEDGEVRSGRRIATSPAALELFGPSLRPEDRGSKNDIHAIVIRRLIGRPPASDLFGVKGRKSELKLPIEERETLESCLRQIAFFDSEIAAVDRLIAQTALASRQARMPMTVPGVNVICAATFLATIGDIGRFRSCARRSAISASIRASGSPGPGPRPTAISRGKAHGRRARRSSRRAGARSANPARCARSTSASAHAAGNQVAVVASARRLACLFWCLLTREHDYAFAQPSLTRKKLRGLENVAGKTERRRDARTLSKSGRQAERELAEQAEIAYERTVRDWQAAAPHKTGASATQGRASSGRQSGKQRGKASVPDPAL